MKYLKVIYQNLVAEYLILIRKPTGLIFSLFFPTLILVVIAISFPGEFLDIVNTKVAVIENETNKALVNSIKEKISSEDFSLDIKQGNISTLEDLIRSKDYLLGIYPELSLPEQTPKITIVIDNSNPAARDTVLNKLMSQITGDWDLSISKREVYKNNLRFIDYLFPGIIGLGIMFFCLTLASIGVVRERISGSLERIRSSPLPLWLFLISKYIAYSILAVVAGVFLLIVGKFFFNIPIAGSVWLVILLELLTAAPFIGLALITSTIGKTEFEVQVIVLFIAVPLIFISGIFFPIQCMPEYIQKVAVYFPLAYSVEALRDIVIRGFELEKILPSLFALAIYSISFFTLTVLMFKKRER